MWFTGSLLAESLRKETILSGVPLDVRRIWRVDAGDPSAGQPLTWTFIAFEVSDATVDEFAVTLSGALEGGPWYCDFHSDDETFVVFADRVFRLRPGRPGSTRRSRAGLTP